jgi:CRP-like cAMP-binding protein
MNSNKFLTGRGRERLTLEEQTLLENNISNVQVVKGRKTLVKRGEPVCSSMLVVESFVCRSTDDHRGRRQIVSLHIPGDFIDFDGLKLKRLDYNVVAIGAAKVAAYTHDALASLSEHCPRLAESFWLSSLLDSAIHRAWIFRLGRLEADGRAAHLFCELHARLEMVGLAQDVSFALPLTQSDLAAALSLTVVHTNRVLRSLRERGLLTFQNRQVEIHDRKALAQLGEFDPAYLYGADLITPSRRPLDAE